MAMSAPENGPRRITILGSTGSIGCNTIDLVEREPEGYCVEALTANRNVTLLAEQARRLRPRVAVVADASQYHALREALSGTNIEVAAGDAAVVEAATRPVDWMMAGIVGAAGLAPTLAGVRQGAIVALANKETLVCAGELVLREVKARNATLLPVDSEHNAVFQVFDFEQADRVARILLTASGGPFRTKSLEEMRRMTPEQAVAHPNWRMGAKISVDSATLMNKGLEVIEAFYLFPVRKDQVDVIVHPQSVIHSMVEYIDGSVLAQLGTPDMRVPIAYGLAWPERIEAGAPSLDFLALAPLTFEPAGHDRFPALALAYQALAAPEGSTAVLNAANEEAVAAFLAGTLRFPRIHSVNARTVDALAGRIGGIGALDDLHVLDARAREVARGLIRELAA